MKFKRKKRMITAWIFLLLAAFAMGQSNTMTVPRLVRFSGVAKDETGHPKTGVLGVTFALYKEEEGGSPLWLEVQNVQADSNGRYSVLLGSTKTDGIPRDLFTSNEARWLGVQLEGQTEQSRVLFVSVPYALKAADAETLGGKPLSAFQLAQPQSADGTMTPSGLAATEQGNEVTCASGTACKSAFVPLFTSNGGSAKVGDSIISQSGGLVTVSGGESVISNVGIGAAPGSFKLQVTAPNQLGATVQGPFSGVGAGLDLDTTGSGGKGWEILATGKISAQGPNKLNIRDLSTAADVFTIAPGGFVGIGTVSPGAHLQVTDQSNPTTNAVIAADLSNSNPGASALFGDALATTGTTHGVFGQIFSSSGGASAVEGVAIANTGQTFGVQALNLSTGDFSAGVAGVSDSSSGKTVGVTGISNSSQGTGVLGTNSGESAVGRNLIGCCRVGVWGDTSGSVFSDTALAGTADNARAIYLENNSTQVPTALMQQDAPNQFALFAGGPNNFCTIDTNPAGAHLHCPGGTASIASVDAGQRQVALYGVESPQHWFEDFGSGRLASGAATIRLEPTFAQTVNTGSEYHVFLTPRGECRGLYISKTSATGFEVHELSGGRSNVAFDYRIVALRRGFENVRLEDMTKRLAKANPPLPKAPPGPGFTTPNRLLAPRVSAQSRVATFPNRIAQQ